MPRPCKLTFDILTLKVVFESHDVTWATSMSILVFLGLFFIDLGPTYATDRRQTDAKLIALPLLLIPCYFVFQLLSRNVFCILPVISKVIEKSI